MKFHLRQVDVVKWKIIYTVLQEAQCSIQLTDNFQSYQEAAPDVQQIRQSYSVDKTKSSRKCLQSFAVAMVAIHSCKLTVAVALEM